MSRLVRRFSWKLLLLVVVLATLSLFAEAWHRYQARQAGLRGCPGTAENSVLAFTPAPAAGPFLTTEPIPAFDLPALPAESAELAPATSANPETGPAGIEAFGTASKLPTRSRRRGANRSRSVAARNTHARRGPQVEPVIEFEQPAAPPKIPAEEPAINPPATPAEATEPAAPSPTPAGPSLAEPRRALARCCRVAQPIDGQAQRRTRCSAAAAKCFRWCLALSHHIVSQLRRLATEEPRVAHWAQQTILQLEDLAKIPTLADPQVGSVLDQLHALSLQAKDLAAPLATDNQRPCCGPAMPPFVASPFGNSVHAVAFESTESVVAIPSTEEWHACLSQLEYKLQTLPGGAPWTNYLRLPQARKLIAAQKLRPLNVALCRTIFSAA